jgi:hypothetical protein
MQETSIVHECPLRNAPSNDGGAPHGQTGGNVVTFAKIARFSDPKRPILLR